MAELVVETTGRGFFSISQELNSFVRSQGMRNGCLHVFIAHTSASLVVTENADPAVLRDLESKFAALYPDGTRAYEHSEEGPDDMPAHLRSVATSTSLLLPVRAGQLALGTWQGAFVWEHRKSAHRRQLYLTCLPAFESPETTVPDY